MFLVRCACRFLIVVDSSTIIMLPGFFIKKVYAACAPRFEDNASTFITKMRSCLSVLGTSIVSSSFLNFFDVLGVHLTAWYSTPRCIGNSFLYQLLIASTVPFLNSLILDSNKSSYSESLYISSPTIFSIFNHLLE